MRTRWLVAALSSIVPAIALARPPRLARGEQPRIEHVADAAPAWLAACPLTLVQDDADTFAVGATCGPFDTMLLERKVIDADELAERARDVAVEADAQMTAIAIPTALGTATGYTFVLQDREGANTYVMVRRAGATKKAPSDVLTCTSGGPGDQLARCKAALETLGRSSLVRSGRAGFPRAAGDRAGT
jgi:hypothetical protein